VCDRYYSIQVFWHHFDDNMPRQGGQGKGKPGRHERDFGRALIKQQTRGSHGFLGTKTNSNLKNMTSILENNALDDFINMVEMDDEDVEVKRYDNDTLPVMLIEPQQQRAQAMSASYFSQEQLVIPRKPQWTFKMSPEEVDLNERNSFLEWRRKIAEFENDSTEARRITPYEKNLEVWRQLWRVCERSHLVIQVVDGRNPLLFYTADLRCYLSELRPAKSMVLIVNKSDLLSEKQRFIWSQYFALVGIKFVFYSAFFEQTRLDQDSPVENTTVDLEHFADILLGNCPCDPVLSTSILSREDLLNLFKLLSHRVDRVDDVGRPFCIGMVGYPNVGKSSCINTLLGVTKSNHGE
jgi:large subunit GTPase 1